MRDKKIGDWRAPGEGRRGATIFARVESEFAEQLDAIAAAKGMNRSQYIREVLAKEVALESKTAA